MGPHVRRSSGYALRALSGGVAYIACVNLSLVNGWAPGKTQAMPDIPHGVLFRLFCIVLILAAAFLNRLGKRLATACAEEVLAHDARPPVLLLRSFADDHKRLSEDTLLAAACWGLRAVWGLPRQRPPFDLDSLEELIESIFSRIGPVVAIGRPGEILPPAGAARLWAADTTWRQRVEALLRESQLVVMVIGKSDGEDGLAWEVRKIFEMDLRAKLVLVAPPLGEAEVRERWEKYHELSGGQVPRYLSGELCAAFHLDHVLPAAGVPTHSHRPAPFWVCSVRQSLTGKRTAEEYRRGLESFGLVQTLARRNEGSKPGRWRGRVALAVGLGAAALLIWKYGYGIFSFVDLSDAWRSQFGG